MRRSDVLPSLPPRFVVLRLAVPLRAPAFVPPSNPTPIRRPGVFGSGNPEPALRNGDDRTSQVPGEPSCVYALLSDPGRTGDIRPYDAPTRPPLCKRRRLPTTKAVFGAQSHGLDTRCLRFARCIATEDARLASRCRPDSTGRDWLPARFLRKVSVMLLTSLPPSPSLLGANAMQIMVAHGSYGVAAAR